MQNNKDEKNNLKDKIWNQIYKVMKAHLENTNL